MASIVNQLKHDLFENQIKLIRQINHYKRVSRTKCLLCIDYMNEWISYYSTEWISYYSTEWMSYYFTEWISYYFTNEKCFHIWNYFQSFDCIISMNEYSKSSSSFYYHHFIIVLLSQNVNIIFTNLKFLMDLIDYYDDST